MNCLHVKFYTLDFANQPNRYPGHCLLCQLEAAESKLDKAERMHREAFDAGVAHQERANALQLRLEALTKERDQLKVDVGMHSDNTDYQHDRALGYMRERDAALLRAAKADDLQFRLEEQAKRLGTMFDLLADVATKERKDALGFVTVSLRMHSDWWRAVDAIVFGSSSAPVESRENLIGDDGPSGYTGSRSSGYEAPAEIVEHVHNYRPNALVPNELVCSCGDYYVV